MKSALEWLGDKATKVLFVGVIAALAVQPLSQLARPFMVIAIFIPLVIALVRLDWSHLGAYARRPLLIVSLTAWILIVSPILVWLVITPLGLPSGLHAGLVLMAAAPPIVSAGAYALLLRLDAPLVVVAIVSASTLVPLTLPPLALWLLDLQIDIGLVEFMLRLAAYIGGAFLVAALIRRFAAHDWLQANARAIDGIGVLSMLVFALAIMHGVTALFFERPGYIALCIAAAFLANLALQAATFGVFLTLGRARAASLGLSAGFCNMGLVLAVLADKAEPDLVVYFAMGQFPIYMLPALLQPVYRRMTKNA